MATTTTPSSPTGVGEANAGRNAADFLDLADSGSQKATQAELAARVEQKRLEHERQRAAQRALFEAQMKALEEEQQREEAALLESKGDSAPPNGTATAPSSPPTGKGSNGASSGGGDKPAPIGPPHQGGFKSMPASRRPSGGSKDDLTFGLGKLSLTSTGSPAANGGAPTAGSYAGKFGFTEEGGIAGKPSININSDSPSWPSFPGGLETQTVPLTGRAPGSTNVSPRVSTAGVVAGGLGRGGASPALDPHHPALNTRSVPGTPQVGFAPSSTASAAGNRSLAAGAAPATLSGNFGNQSGLISPAIHAAAAGNGTAGDKTPGLGAGPARGFSNPDLTQAFSRSLGAGFQKSGDDYTSLGDDFGVVDPNVYQSIGLGGRARGMGQYGFDYDGRNSFAIDSKIDGLGGVKHKRAELDRDTEFNRFAGTRLEDLQGEILPLCKDQHGCRYLQKKLEEGVPEHRDMIFRETYGHFSDLMTDPFGNYLCQKLLEHTTDEQRNAICESVAPDLVTVSLNMHGTRAVQKMIDFLSTPRQIHSIIMALQASVVPLIKDLNGNHVIQKCLNRLVPEDNQFIYNAVAAHCVEVATHRHGCCVLQRCIDHAADSQRVQLVTEITYHGLTLVQDPFGNYVVQYVLDLNDNRFSDAVTRQFFGNVCALSVQKFSSNVIEKCIRVAEPETRKALIAELLNRNRLEKLLRDSFANYVVQTALDYAEPGQRMLLVECIRPILPMIRNTPYGKRIQSKLQREHMEHHHPYGGGNGGGGGGNGGYNQQAALLNLALGGGGGIGQMNHPPPPVHAPHRNLGNRALHHPNALAEAYGGGRGLGGFANGNNGGGLQQQQQQQQLDHFGNVAGGGPQGQYGLGAGGFGMAGGLGDFGQQPAGPFYNGM